MRSRYRGFRSGARHEFPRWFAGGKGWCHTAAPPQPAVVARASRRTRFTTSCGSPSTRRSHRQRLCRAWCTLLNRSCPHTALIAGDPRDEGSVYDSAVLPLSAVYRCLRRAVTSQIVIKRRKRSHVGPGCWEPAVERWKRCRGTTWRSVVGLGVSECDEYLSCMGRLSNVA